MKIVVQAAQRLIASGPSELALDVVDEPVAGEGRNHAGTVLWTAFTDAKSHHGDYIVSAEIDGEYDKTGLPDPLVLTF